MKILFVVPYIPSLVRVRSYSFLKFLAARGHEIHLATLWADDQEKADGEQIRPFIHKVSAFRLPRWRSLWNCLLAVPFDVPLQYVYCWHPDLAKHILTLLTASGETERFDVIHIEHLRGARYGSYLQKANQPQSPIPPIVWDSVDCISLLFSYTASENKNIFTRLVTAFDLPRTSRCEAKLIRRFNRTVVTSPKDRDALLELQPGAAEEHLTVISQGVDLDYFSEGYPDQRQPATLVMSGKMSYHANVAMANYLVDEILPQVWSQKPDAKLVIVGKDPPASVREYDHHPLIEVTGTVPDIRPYIQQATLAVAPLRYGVGVQNKVLEAMACGTPVVTTPQVLTSLSAKPGIDLLIGESPQEFAQAILRLLDNPQLRAQIGTAGRNYVTENHVWNTIAGRLEGVYRSAIEEYQKQKSSSIT